MREKGKGKREAGIQRVAKRVAPNEPTVRAKGRPGIGRGRKAEVRSTKRGGVAEQRKLSVVSFQLSVECLAATRRGARGNCGLWISDRGIEIRRKDHELWFIDDRTTGESRITNHANAQWPNKPISPQDQRGKRERPDVASIGGLSARGVSRGTRRSMEWSRRGGGAGRGGGW